MDWNYTATRGSSGGRTHSSIFQRLATCRLPARLHAPFATFTNAARIDKRERHGQFPDLGMQQNDADNTAHLTQVRCLYPLVCMRHGEQTKSYESYERKHPRQRKAAKALTKPKQEMKMGPRVPRSHLDRSPWWELCYQEINREQLAQARAGTWSTLLQGDF